MATTKLYEVWADVILSCKYEVEAITWEEAVEKVASGELTEKEKTRAMNPLVTSVEVSEGDKS